MKDMWDLKGAASPAAEAGMPRTGAAGPEEPKSFDFRKYFFLVMKWWWVVALSFFVGIVLSLAIIVQQEPRFRATAKLQLKRPTGIPSNLQVRDYESIWGDYARTEMNLIQGKPVVELAKKHLEEAGLGGTANGLSLSVDRLRETAVLTINVEGAEPKACADYANAIADAYLEYKAQSRGDMNRDTVTTLSQQATALSQQISDLERQLVDYRRDNGLVAIEELGNPPAETLARLTRQAMDYRIQRMLLEAQQPLLAEASDEVVLAALQAGALPGGFALPTGMPGAAEVAAGMLPGGAAGAVAAGPQTVTAEALVNQGLVEPPRWGDLKRENTLLRARLATYRKRYKDKHPLVAEAQRKLQENEDALQVELQFALDQYYSELEALTIKEKSAAEVEQSLEAQAEEIDQKRNEYASLQRNLKRLNGLYDVIFNRLQEVDIATASQLDTAVIWERAEIPASPINPRNLQTLFMAALLGLAAGLALVLLIEFMDDTLRYPDEVSKALRAPFLGMVPGAHWEASTAADYWLPNVAPSSGFAEAYRNIRSAILLRPGGDSFKTLAITSSVPREGKTTTAANLATSFALSGKRVLLVDADLHRGKLHKMFGLPPIGGFSDVLAGGDWTAQVQRTSVENLDFMATGAFPENPAEVVMRPELRAFMDAASEVYDLVVFDAPPALAVSETAVLAALADAYMLVVLCGRTSRKLARVSLQQMDSRGANLLGVLLNNLDMSRMGGNAYNYYYSYYGYDYSYEEEPGDERAAPPSQEPVATSETGQEPLPETGPAPDSDEPFAGSPAPFGTSDETSTPLAEPSDSDGDPAGKPTA